MLLKQWKKENTYGHFCVKTHLKQSEHCLSPRVLGRRIRVEPSDPDAAGTGPFGARGTKRATSLADDVATTRQILAELEGPTLLVGHSYGGFVISEAATEAPGVVGLVYISAFILDEGETLLGSGAQFPQLEVFQHLLVSAQGLTWIQPRRVFWLRLRCLPTRVSSRRKPGGQHGSPCPRGRCLGPRIA